MLDGINTKSAYIKEVNRRIKIINDNIKILQKNDDVGVDNSQLETKITSDTSQAIKNLKLAKNLLENTRGEFK